MRTPTIRPILIAFGAISFFFVALNLLTNGDSFWAIWPIWAFSMFAGAAIGFRLLRGHRLLGLWIGGGFFLIAGLLGIDIRDSGDWWFFWPAGVWLLFSLIFVGATVDILSTIPTSRPATEDDEP